MGIGKTVEDSVLPKQGIFLGKEVKVCFNYDLSNQIDGKIVRDDMESPYKTIIESPMLN